MEPALELAGYRAGECGGEAMTITDRQVAEAVLYRGFMTTIEALVANGTELKEARARVERIHNEMRDEGKFLWDFDDAEAGDES